MGLEIGAQNVPTKVNARTAQTEYVDRLTAEQTSVQFGIPIDTLVKVTHLTDGGRLDSFPSASRDYLIANHVLEHFDDPVGAVIEWLRVLAPAGRLLITLPNYRNNQFDFRRRPPTRRHFERDYLDADHRAASERDHYCELVQSIYGFPEDDPVIPATADVWIERGDRSHYHVYDEFALRDVLELAAEKSGIGLRIVDQFLIDSGFEYLVVLEKHAAGPLKWPDPVRSRASALALMGSMVAADVPKFYGRRAASAIKGSSAQAASSHSPR
ncbi:MULTISPECIES: methyltransferase domain-containing protein [Paraburkholderia]|uniref:methyltransferase domain-containing protein n=1 Tax=Paraburkholderia TaxID=1822464 RepID=UPI00224CD6F4|nr:MULTISPECIES: methyltransferase domain-containing protein [Paraburkholderia]MCX4155012.1 methyltransferase domain-containing protein [Paraburkholderia aspalathi]MDN7164422.1 class I SAM-dependent methyltransferase [Paraburkholderia sp. SECH2]MDQ6392907.1 class I SAM-dependent methyltransferase [Paraburkholderia aspalathi]